MRLILLIALLAACDNTADSRPTEAATTEAAVASAGTRSDVDIATFATALDAGAKVIDVRTPSEFGSGHVQGAINLPISSFSTSDPAVADHPRDEPLYVICAVGGRSSVVADRLAKAGFTAVNVEGGTAAWQRAGKAVE